MAADIQEKDFNALGESFKQCIGHMKGGFQSWEDFVSRGFRFQKQLEQMISAFNAFLEGFTKISELACSGKGATHDIGVNMSHLILWQKGQELKMREINQALQQKLLNPLQAKIEEWKKTTSHMDREHERDVKEAVREIKESIKTTQRLSVKMNKKNKSAEKRSAVQVQYDQQHQLLDRRIRESEERERLCIGRVLMEERTWYCGFVLAFSKMVEIQMVMMGDVDRLQNIMRELSSAVTRPTELPEANKEFLENWSIPAAAASPSLRKRLGSQTASHSHTISAPAGNHSLSNLSNFSASSQESLPTAGSPSNQPSPIPVAPPPPPPTSNDDTSCIPPPPPQAPFAPPPPPSFPQSTSQSSLPPPPLPSFPQTIPGPPHQSSLPVPPPPCFPQQVVYEHPTGLPPPPAPSFPPPPPSNLPPPPPPSFPHPTPSQPVQTHRLSDPYSSSPQYSVLTNLPPNSSATLPHPCSYAATPATYAQTGYSQPGYAMPGLTALHVGPRHTHPPGVYSDEHHYEPASPTATLSISPSQASLMSNGSHQSSGSSRSLSPPIGPSQSPGQSRTNLGSLQEDRPPSLQEALANKLRMRHAQSMEAVGATSTRRPSPPGIIPPGIARQASMDVRSTAPVVPRRAPPVAHKPPRVPSVHGSLPPGYGNGVPFQATPPLPVHHALQTQAAASSSDSDEEELSDFAKALRQKKLKKGTSAAQ